MQSKPICSIRPLVASDEAAWRVLWHGYLTYYETTLPEEVYRTTFSRLISGEPNEYCGLLALVAGRPVGLAHYLFHRTCRATNDTCYLQDLYADPSVRGQGIGRALIEAVYAAADAARPDPAAPSRVYWLTQEFNATARRLYDRIGIKTPFIKYGRP